MSNLRQSIQITVGLVLAGLATLIVTACAKHPATMGPAGGKPPVGFVIVKPQNVPITMELSGRTVPFQIAEVRPQVNGIIQQRKFREGSDVKAGETLYQIDPATYRAAYNSAAASLAKAEASLYSAKLKSQRYDELVGIKAVSLQDHDDAIAALGQAQADVASAKAALETDRINLAYTRVIAPISGRIGRSEVTPGALVTANQTTTIATVQQLDPMYVDVTQSSAAVLKLKREIASGQLVDADQVGAKVKLVLEDGSSYPLPGALQFSDVTVDQNTGTVTLRIVFPNPKHELLPGMYVRAIVEEGVREQALLVPQPAVTRDATGNATAMIIDASDKAQLRTLETDRTIGNQWLLRSGLKSGDRLIVDGLQKVRPGMAVSPVAANEVPAVAAGAATESVDLHHQKGV